MNCFAGGGREGVKTFPSFSLITVQPKYWRAFPAATLCIPDLSKEFSMQNWFRLKTVDLFPVGLVIRYINPLLLSIVRGPPAWLQHLPLHILIILLGSTSNFLAKWVGFSPAATLCLILTTCSSVKIALPWCSPFGGLINLFFLACSMFSSTVNHSKLAIELFNLFASLWLTW